MELEKVIKERFSCRKFSSRKVDNETIDKILEAGILAPSAKNLCPVHVYVVRDGIDKINQCSNCIYGASTVFIICVDMSKVYKSEYHDTSDVDGSICATHMMLRATDLGVDNIWVDMFDRELIRSYFSIPDNMKIVAIMPIGYKTEETHPSHLHNERPTLDEFREFI